MRGTNSSHVLVLLDGAHQFRHRRVYGARTRSCWTASSVSKWCAATSAACMASEAIGGVIQLFTEARARRTTSPECQRRFGQPWHRGDWQPVFPAVRSATSFSLNAGKNKTDWCRRSRPASCRRSIPITTATTTPLSNVVQHAINADHRISASWFSSRADSQYDNAFGATTDRNNTLSNINKLSLALDDQLSAMYDAS